MSERIIYVDRFELNEGKLAELRTYASDLAALVEEKEPGVLSLHYYADEGGARGTAVIVFADAAALDRYLDLASSRFAAAASLLRAADIELLGAPSEGAAAMTRSYGGRVMRAIVGFAR